jgi:Glyoxalase-like domain
VNHSSPACPRDPQTHDRARKLRNTRVPADGDADAEVERLIALGARHADVGQSGTEGFVVLADPEGNEFCVLRR